MKLNKLESRSRNTEVDAIAKQIFTAHEESSLTEDVHLSKMMSELNEFSFSMTSAIGSVATESSLEEDDNNRDEAVRSLFNFVRR